MAYEQIIYEVADNIATITLNRPEKLNAFTGIMMNEMLDAFDKTDADDNVRAIIVTGAGRAFCAGADLSAGPRTFDASREDRPDRKKQARQDIAAVERLLFGQGDGLVRSRSREHLDDSFRRIDEPDKTDT